MSDAGFRIKGVDRGHAFQIDGDRHDDQTFRSKSRLQAVEYREFVTARLAPCRPEVEQHDFAGEGIEGQRVARGIGELERRQDATVGRCYGRPSRGQTQGDGCQQDRAKKPRACQRTAPKESSKEKIACV